MAKVSATVVTLNEEDNIRDCLETLTWCDEIIIVDSFSDDRTIDIAQEYTDKIFTYERTGYSEPAREKALEEASGEWICMIDADERVPERLATKLRRFADKNELDVVHAPRKNYILGQWIDCAGWWPDYRPVLYRQSVARLSPKIHEFISFSESAEECYLEETKRNSIIHYNYTDINDFISRMNRYTDIEAEQSEFSYLKCFTSPINEFIQRYFIERGYKKGFTGLILAIFMSWYRFLTMAKAWQYKKIGNHEEINKRYSCFHNSE